MGRGEEVYCIIYYGVHSREVELGLGPGLESCLHPSPPTPFDPFTAPSIACCPSGLISLQPGERDRKSIEKNWSRSPSVFIHKMFSPKSRKGLLSAKTNLLYMTDINGLHCYIHTAFTVVTYTVMADASFFMFLHERWKCAYKPFCSPACLPVMAGEYKFTKRGGTSKAVAMKT